MDYAARRILASFGTCVGVAAVLLVFLFPTTRVEPWFQHRCYGGPEILSFRPLWNLGGLPSDVFGLCLEAGLALTIGACVWFLYPAVRPQRRP